MSVPSISSPKPTGGNLEHSARLLSQVPAVPAAPPINRPTAAPANTPPDDPNLWLEENNPNVAEWVKNRNAQTEAALTRLPGFDQIRADLLGVLNNKARIPYVNRVGDYVYNVRRDESNPGGVWRRTTLAKYRESEPGWDILLDLDKLTLNGTKNWSFSRAVFLPPDYKRCLVFLSRGGADATVVREFDLEKRDFVENGFYLPEAKSTATWLDRGRLLVGTDFGPGSLTNSGYPSTIKIWKRGKPLASAERVFAGDKPDLGTTARVDHTPGFERVVVTRNIDFYSSEHFLLQRNKLGDKLVPLKLNLPKDAKLSWQREWVYLELRSVLKTPKATLPAGSLVAIRWNDLLNGGSNFDVLFTPTATRILAEDSKIVTSDRLLITVLDNVASKLEELSYDKNSGKWKNRPVNGPFPDTPSQVVAFRLSDSSVPNDPYANQYLFNYSNFLQPNSLYLAQVGSDQLELLKQQPASFNSTGMRVKQDFATSKDGTPIPYFVVWPNGAKADSTNPTILHGYGGFETSMEPKYNAHYGAAWLGRGGVYVLANIRGGGEFPQWHQAATKENKQNSYDDLIAVAEDLIAKTITSPQHLGLIGHSNGGLLVGAVMVQRPDLFGAVVAQQPLLDMKRYTKMPPGASWTAEYGDPDKPEEWRYISQYSPYQNIKPDVPYPPMLITTIRGDRVNPAHGRKTAARMLAYGYQVFYYESADGSHDNQNADAARLAHKMALEFTFLWDALGPKKPRTP